MLSPDQLCAIYRTMIRIRCFEERMVELYLQGQMYGNLHTSIGHEAAQAGACAALLRDDYLTTGHRGNGHFIAKGGDLGRIAAELMGREAGYSKGRAGKMHLSAREVGVLCANGIVGGGIPLAVGAALAIQRRRGRQVVASFFGDGATNQGTFHEGINLASLWRLPVVFVCENNRYAISVPFERATAGGSVADRAAAYGIPGVAVDGNDPIAVHEAMAAAVERARRGDGPTLTEARTYRLRGHHEGDPENYRTKDEVAEWRQRDPIPRFRDRLIAWGHLTEATDARLWTEVKAELDAAIAFAQASPFPDPASLAEAVYAEEAID